MPNCKHCCSYCNKGWMCPEKQAIEKVAVAEEVKHILSEDV